MKAELLHDLLNAWQAVPLSERRRLREARVRAWVRDEGWTGRPSDDFEGCTE